MLIAITLFLAMLFLGAVAAQVPTRSHPHRDLLGPVVVTGALHALTILPYLVLLAFDEDVMRPAVRASLGTRDLTEAVASYAGVQIVGFVAIVVGLRMPLGSRWARRIPVMRALPETRWVAATLLALCVGLVGMFQIMLAAGGHQALIANLDRRTEVTSGGGGAWLVATGFLSTAAVLAVRGLARRRSAARVAFAVTIAAIAAMLYTSLGGRKPTLLLAVSLLFAWHYCVRRLRRVPWRVMGLLAAATVPYIIAMPLLRTPGAFATYSVDPSALLRDIGNDLERAVADVSYVDNYVFIVNYFSTEPHWWGAVYGDLLEAFVPSSLYPDKPPVDDGVYVYTLAHGLPASPGTPARYLTPSSWPPETLGTMYMNFGLAGVLLGGILLGCIYRCAYAYMLRSECHVFAVLVYAYVLFSFHLSNLRIIQTTLVVGATTVFFVLAGKSRGVRRPARPPALAWPHAGRRRVRTGRISAGVRA